MEDIEKATLKVGDVVVMKGHDITMTVGSCDGSNCDCWWFNGKELKGGHFHVDMIEIKNKVII